MLPKIVLSYLLRVMLLCSELSDQFWYRNFYTRVWSNTFSSVMLSRVTWWTVYGERHIYRFQKNSVFGHICWITFFWNNHSCNFIECKTDKNVIRQQTRNPRNPLRWPERRQCAKSEVLSAFHSYHGREWGRQNDHYRGVEGSRGSLEKMT